MSSACLPGHRRLRARDTVRMMPISIRKGSQVFRKPAQLDEVEERRENEEEKGMKERNREVMSLLYVFPPPSILIKSC